MSSGQFTTAITGMDEILSSLRAPEPPVTGMAAIPGIAKATATPPYVDRYTRFAQSQHRGVIVGSFGIALGPDVLFEIVESAKLSPLPGVSSICKGLTNHRGNVVPVYDIAELADAAPPVWERRRLLILDTTENAVGILLYDLPVHIGTDNRIPPGEISDTPEIFRRHACGAFLNKDRLWLILDRESFFSELNKLCLQLE